MKQSACDFFWESSSENSKTANNDRIYFSSFSKNRKCDGSSPDQLKGKKKQTKIIITLWTHCRVLFPSQVQPVSISNYSTIPPYTLLSGPSSYHILPPFLKNPLCQLTVNDINQNTSVKHSCFPPTLLNHLKAWRNSQWNSCRWGVSLNSPKREKGDS